MKLTHKTSVSLQAFSTDESQLGSSLADNEIQSVQDETSSLFPVLSYEYKQFQLDSSNAFSKDLFSIIETAKADITYLYVSCYVDGTVKKPVRFDIEVAASTLMTLSEFVAANSDGLAGFADFTVKNVAVTTGETAQLMIVVGSKDKNTA